MHTLTGNDAAALSQRMIIGRVVSGLDVR